MSKIATKENVDYADYKARQHKRSGLKYIKKHDSNGEEENRKLVESLKDGSFKTSPYTKAKIYEPKERVLYKLPYYPDRIAQHAIMNVTEPI